MKKFGTVLITGTTSGLGRAFLKYYYDRGAQVIGVNRRPDETLSKEFPRALFQIIEIDDYQAVKSTLSGLQAGGQTPDILILNAGINRADNWDGLNYPEFEKTMRTNLMGVMTFVGAIHELKWKNRVIVGVSSTSNIIPNPAHIGYHLSKAAIKSGFQLLQRNDPGNFYKYVVLGPVHTRIMADYPGPQGVQKRIFDWLAVNPDQVAEVSGPFFAGNKRALNFTRKSWWFYQFVKLILFFAPGIYSGSKAEA